MVFASSHAFFIIRSRPSVVFRFLHIPCTCHQGSTKASSSVQSFALARLCLPAREFVCMCVSNAWLPLFNELEVTFHCRSCASFLIQVHLCRVVLVVGNRNFRMECRKGKRYSLLLLLQVLLSYKLVKGQRSCQKMVGLMFMVRRASFKP